MPEWSKSRPIILITAVIAVALLINGFFAFRFFTLQGQRDDVAYELEDTRHVLGKFKGAAALQAELEQAEESLKSQQSVIPDKLSSPQVVDSLSSLAESSGLKVSEVYSQPGDEITEGENSYSSLTIRIRLLGEMESLIDFLRELEEGAIGAVILDSLSIANDGESSEASASQSGDTGGDSVPQVDLSITVFGRNG